MHLTLFNHIQVDVHVEFCFVTFSVNGVEDLGAVYVFHLLIEFESKSVFTVYLHNEWIFYRDNFLTFQWK